MLRRGSAPIRTVLALAAAVLLVAGCTGPSGGADEVAPADGPALEVGGEVDEEVQEADGDDGGVDGDDGAADEDGAADGDGADDGVGGADAGDGAADGAEGDDGTAEDADGGSADDREEADAGAADESAQPAEQALGTAIRDVDLSALEWREAITEEYITPARDSGLVQYVLAETIAYADVDGDGHEDALAGLEILDGQGFQQIWYIWTWDEQARTAVQVENPIARMARCGDSVLEVAAAEGSFALTEALRPAGDTSDCASAGHIRFTRHVALEDGWPVLTGGVEGHGGICPQPAATDALFPAGYPMHPGPLETMSVLGDPAPVSFGEVDVSAHLWLFREHWMLVHVTTEEPVDQRGGYVPCAWVHLEEDTRPVPHAPHLPEG